MNKTNNKQKLNNVLNNTHNEALRSVLAHNARESRLAAEQQQ